MSEPFFDFIPNGRGKLDAAMYKLMCRYFRISRREIMEELDGMLMKHLSREAGAALVKWRGRQCFCGR